MNKKKERGLLIVSIIIQITFLSGCMSNLKYETFHGGIVCHTDITHNGVEEDLYVTYLPLTYNNMDLGFIDVVDMDGKGIWGRSFGLPHAGWVSYYLVTINGEDFIFQYCPEESQGLYSDYYKLFFLDSAGNEISVAEMNLANADADILGERLEEFYEKSEEYISRGELLVSTWENELKYYGQ